MKAAWWALILLVLPAACSSRNREVPYAGAPGASYADPGEAALKRELEALPFRHLLWSFRYRNRIERVTLGVDHLYLESDTPELIAMDRRTGETKWKYRIDSGQALEWAPAEATGVPEEIRSLEENLYQNWRQIDDVIKEKGPGPESEELWKLRRRDQGRLLALRNGDNLYFLSQQVLYCLDRITGNLRWKKRLDFAASGRPFAGSDRLYVAGGDLPRVWSLDVNAEGRWVTFFRPELASDGKNHVMSQPVYRGQTLFFASHDGRIYAVDVTERRQRWTYATEREIKADPILHTFQEFPRNRQGEIVADKEGRGAAGRPRTLLLVGGLDRAFYAVDAESGSLHWKYECGEPIMERAVAAGDSVYVRNTAGELLSMELNPQHFGTDGLPAGPVRTGRLRWKIPKGERFLMRTKEAVFVLTSDGAVLELDEETGTVRARFPMKQFRYFPTNTMDEVFYAVHPSGHVFALRTSKEDY